MYLNNGIVIINQQVVIIDFIPLLPMLRTR